MNHRNKRRIDSKKRKRAKRVIRSVQPDVCVTMASYGAAGRTAFMGVVVSQGAEHIAQQIFHAKDYKTGELMAEAATAYASAMYHKHKAGQPVHILDELQPMRSCPCCDEIMLCTYDSKRGEV